MTDRTHWTGQQWTDHARREVQQLGRKLIADGCPARAWQDATKPEYDMGPIHSAHAALDAIGEQDTRSRLDCALGEAGE